MTGSLAKKLFFYTSWVLALVMLGTFLVLGARQSTQWEAHLIAQSLSFVRLATPELLKRLRGDFSGPARMFGQNGIDFIAINRDVVLFSLWSPTGKLLYQSPRLPDFVDLQLPEGEIPLRLQDYSGVRYDTVSVGNGGRVLIVEMPALGPTGETIVVTRFVFSYDSVDMRIHDLRRDIIRIAALAFAVAFILAAFVARRVVQPVRQLITGVKQIAQGDLSVRMATDGRDEIATLVRGFNEMAESLATSRNELTLKNLELEQANSELRATQEQLVRSEKLAVLGQLAAGVSHEIDNPVGIILGHAELMYEDLADGDPLRDDARTIIEECKRCRRITGGLLGFARTAVASFQEVSMVGLLERTVSSLQPQKLFKHLQIVILDETSGSAVVHGDEDKLTQILFNLCLNAAQAMNGQGTLRMILRQQGEMISVDLCDTGPGVPTALREKIFEPFYSTKGSGEGTGLGLPICRRLAEDHGGSLACIDGHVEGGCFRLELPASRTKNL